MEHTALFHEDEKFGAKSISCHLNLVLKCICQELQQLSILALTLTLCQSLLPLARFSVVVHTEVAQAGQETTNFTAFL